MSKANLKTNEQKLADAEKTLAQAKARLQQVKAQQTEAERKADAKRKILLGAVVLKKCEINEEIKEEVWKWLDASLFENRDRVVFDLPLKEEAKKETAAAPELVTEAVKQDAT